MPDSQLPKLPPIDINRKMTAILYAVWIFSALLALLGRNWGTFITFCMYVLMDRLGFMKGRMSLAREARAAISRWADDRVAVADEIPLEVQRQDAQLALAILTLEANDRPLEPFRRPFDLLRRRWTAWRFSRRNAPPLDSRS